MKSKYKSGFVSGTIKQVSELVKPLQFEDMGTKLEAIQVLLNTASKTIKDLQLQIEINLRAKDRANYDSEDMRRTIEKVKK
tara:strand:+ start:40 stop:282 length:243 start_codon:yes stop_codon:yes gene_type:complete